jgi:transcriptional regulator with XRE-family HTH domain
MLKKKNVLRFILGLKIRQLRSKSNLSLKELAESADLSISYLNEIENGKKYPKIEKLAALAHGLGVDLGDLVSFKTGRNLHPLLKFLESDMVGKIPLELFGLSEADVVDLMGHDPEKFASFVLTVLQISRSFDMKLDDVYAAALRSFIEANDNYFPDIEKQASDARKNLQNCDYEEIAAILKDQYNYIIDESALSQTPFSEEIKFSVKRSSPQKLLLNPKLKNVDKIFYVAKELGYHLINTGSNPVQKSLGALLEDFKTSYFAGAILLNEELFSEDLRVLFEKPVFDVNLFLKLLTKYKVSPEVLFHRLTQVLPSQFKVNELFFLGVSTFVGNTEKYSIDRELHLSQLHSPHGVRMNESYCQRWVAIKSIKALKNMEEYSVLGQISVVEDGQAYFSISLGKKSSIKDNHIESLTIGFLVNEELKGVIKFLDDTNLKRIDIGQTCERCPNMNCEERLTAPTIHQSRMDKESMEKSLALLTI